MTLAVRDATAGERTASEIRETTGAAVRVGWLDLADLNSVWAFVSAWNGPLHLLINNAGVMALPSRQLTAHGWELQLATNHLGHFALTRGLHDALAAGANSGAEARVVSVSSRGHPRSPVVFEDLHFAERAYYPWLAYSQSKTANVLLAVEAHRRWSPDGITANAVHPGAIFETGRSRHMSADVLERVWTQVRERQAQSGGFGLKTPNRARRRRCSSQPPRSSMGSAGAISRTATGRTYSTPDFSPGAFRAHHCERAVAVFNNWRARRASCERVPSRVTRGRDRSRAASRTRPAPGGRGRPESVRRAAHESDGS
jgi:NAD(P)-dependent dehydrogenase (short-subunit alcohol dehydrogenase family)